ncbi:sulfatase-like hydrolase/transferase [Flavobacterium sp. CS20]|uniref:sulfatase-like hydrolase/transferase n=1 Tax=Flavobacterium sp. CS20 TaxID=2775246 RepID=UPI001B3A573F|nr:sulfatase-like hydrolase/transferase [Flavobacterium sp. CS20]QTY27214.1 sulfatase-like hydrolase/transferase [Flavobacterium sp. CS20]
MALPLFKIIKNLLQSNRTAIVYWLLPLFLSLLFQAYGFGWNRILPRNFVENVATLIIIVSFSLLFKNQWRKFFQILGYILFVFNNLFESIYYYLFKANISASSIFILLETNLAEAREFVEFYLNPFIVIAIVTYLVVLIFYLIKRPVFTFPKTFKYQYVIYTAGVLIPLALMIYRGFQQYNFLYLSVSSVYEYIEEQQKMLQYNIDEPLADVDGFEFRNKNDTATYVLIIGESTTRRRMSVYGYNRKTTPFLDSLKSDLWLYNNVISSHAHTIGALKDALTLNSLSTDKDFSIIQLMNQAGFKTFWISNQRPIGQYESLVTLIARSSDKYLTKNTAKDGAITPYDEVLLPEFKKALKDKASKKFIVLHPLGTHLLYSDRYPEEFKKFVGKSPSNFDHQQAHRRSNAYDNSVLYHDYFLKQVIDEVAKIEHPVYVLYFSDHGDEVYESIDFSGHAEENPTKSMLEIPFFIWMNKSFKNEFKAQYIPENPYILRDFMHTFSELNGIRFRQFDSTKSIFHKQSKNLKPKVLKGIYYKDLP